MSEIKVGNKVRLVKNYKTVPKSHPSGASACWADRRGLSTADTYTVRGFSAAGSIRLEEDPGILFNAAQFEKVPESLDEKIALLDQEIEGLRKERHALYEERKEADRAAREAALAKWRSELSFGARVKLAARTGTVVLVNPKFNPETGNKYYGGTVVLVMLDDRGCGCNVGVHGEAGLYLCLLHSLTPVE